MSDVYSLQGLRLGITALWIDVCENDVRVETMMMETDLLLVIYRPVNDRNVLYVNVLQEQLIWTQIIVKNRYLT